MALRVNIFTIVLLFLADRCFTFLLESTHGAASLNFLVLGDWGGISLHPFSTPVQTSVAEQMAIVSERENASFVMTLGDNFYLYGVTDVTDPRFQTTFEAVYHEESLQIPWYVIAGNHDHYGNVSAQIEYSKYSKRWKFPDFYYKVNQTIPGGKTLDIILIDTIQLCGNVYSVNKPPVGPKDNATAQTQWAWIEKTLNESTADYILVSGHYPIYSVAEHGPTDCLIQRLEPMLYHYNVTAYLAGHDHNLQHLQMTRGNQTMNYFIIGAGNFVDPSQAHSQCVASSDLKFMFADLMYFGGFSYFEVTDSEMKIRFIDGIGKVRHEYTMSPRYRK